MIRCPSLALFALAALAQVSDYTRGIGLLRDGHAPEAVPVLARVAETHPEDARAWEALGLAYATQNLYASAEPAFAHACKLMPSLEDACYYHARALYAIERFEESLTALSRAPESWKVHLAAAQAHDGLGSTNDAGREFRRATSLCHDADPQPGVLYGAFLLRQARTAEALQQLEHAIAAFPQNADAHLQLGRALMEQGSIPAAVTHLETALKFQLNSAQAHLLLGKAYVRIGRIRDAEPHFAAAADLEQAH